MPLFSCLLRDFWATIWVNELGVYEAKIEESEEAGCWRGWTQDTSGLSHQLDSFISSVRQDTLECLEWENRSTWILSWWREFSGRPLTEFWHHILSGCQVCDWGIQYHLCSTHRGLWGLVVVQLSWLSGRALVAQARDILGSILGDCRPFHFPLLRSKFIYFQHVARCSELY